MLRLPRLIAHAMVEHAESQRPVEACGLLGGREGAAEIDRFAPVRNTAESPVRYVLDPQEMLDVEKQFEADGLDVVGVMHSHPSSEAYPSAVDTADAAQFDPFGVLHFVIVSVASLPATTRSFRILDGTVTEVAIQIVEL